MPYCLPNDISLILIIERSSGGAEFINSINYISHGSYFFYSNTKSKKFDTEVALTLVSLQDQEKQFYFVTV